MHAFALANNRDFAERAAIQVIRQACERNSREKQKFELWARENPTLRALKTRAKDGAPATATSKAGHCLSGTRPNSKTTADSSSRLLLGMTAGSFVRKVQTLVKDTPEFQQWFEASVKALGLKAPTASAGDFEDEERRIRELPYKPFAKQDEFHNCKAKYRLFGGAAGPGKSKALLMEAIAQATKFPNVNTLLLRRTFPELEGSLLLYFRRDVPRELYRSFNEAKHIVTWHNGSTTRFGYSQSENDIYQYQSGEYLFIGVDELTHFTLRQWQFLTSRNRCPVANAFPNMAGATNPGNIGHAWVKALFVDKQPAAGMDPREYDAADYAFIPARVSDNPIYANDASYLKTLEKLPDAYRRAFLDGDWSVFAGQYFTNFDPSRSVIRAESIAAEAWWPRWVSVDWGFEHPAAVYWHTSAPAVEGRRRRLEDSHTHGYGCDLPAQNAEIPRAGVADLFS